MIGRPSRLASAIPRQRWADRTREALAELVDQLDQAGAV
jgi:uncharacterized protein YjiS (DUF1127 family)